MTCDSCGSGDTWKLVSLSNHRFPTKHKYSEDFVEKSMPFLKSRKELKGMFEKETGDSDEAKAMKMSDQIGSQIDRVIHKQISDMKSITPTERRLHYSEGEKTRAKVRGTFALVFYSLGKEAGSR